jgi:hypothetical protein
MGSGLLNKMKGKMQKYYIMDCNIPVDEEDKIPMVKINHYADLSSHSLRSGITFGKTIETPITFEFERLYGYQGPPTELEDTGLPIMSENLAQALIYFGIDCIEFYNVILKEKNAGQTYPYRAYNITSLVKAIDLPMSDNKSYDSKPVADTSFKSLEMDGTKAKDFPISRLAENVNAILVHERL